MKHACETCGQKYAIPDERVAGKVLRVRCQKCSGVMLVDGSHMGLGDCEVAVARVVRHVGPREWYLGIGGKPHGPFAADEVIGRVERGEVRERTFMWRTGMTQWRRVNEASELSFVLDAVREREAAAGTGVFRTPTSVFESVPAALVTDGRAYFPDPTLHTGFTVLSEEARAYLDAVVRRENAHRHHDFRRTLISAAAFVALTLVGAAGAWAASLM